MLASTGAVLLAVGSMAALAPARRAARMDPMATLRQE
jgi:ABC-type lipoprotein release transport system permease subunit